MTALSEDDLALRPSRKWALPVELDKFKEWCEAHDQTVKSFSKLPAWKNAPASLRKAAQDAGLV